MNQEHEHQCEACGADATANYYSLETCNDDTIGVVVCATCIKVEPPGLHRIIVDRRTIRDGIRAKFEGEIAMLRKRIRADRLVIADRGADDITSLAASIKANARAVVTLQNMFYELTGYLLDE